MLKLFALFHLNLMYSSIAEDQRPLVVDRCYEPLLDLAEGGLPLALEAPGLTLEMIRDVRPGTLARMRRLVAAGRATFVGSGYSQIIGPLVPAAVNRRNLALGLQTYRDLLDCEPSLWLVGEMAYSAGLPRLYREAGARAIVMEWNNPRKEHPEWDRRWAFHRQRALGAGAAEVPVVWIDTLDFQQLQRRVRDEITRDEFLAHWEGRRALLDGGDGFAAAYASDAEVFGFRPGRFRDEGSALQDEWGRLETALRDLGDLGDLGGVGDLGKWGAGGSASLVPITAVLDEPDGPLCGRPLQLESRTQPVVVKKQEKYNLNRWAVTGRGDLEANTACHRILADLAARQDAGEGEWRRLLRLWSSDLRTHVTAGRWQTFLDEIGPQAPPAGVFLTGQPLPPPPLMDGRFTLDTGAVKAVIDARRGLVLRSVGFPGLAEDPVRGPALGTLPHGTFDDIALGADFYTGHAVVQQPGRPKLTDLKDCGPLVELVRTGDGGLAVGACLHDGDLIVRKQIVLYRDRPRLELRGVLSLPSRQAAEIHPVHLTFPPGFLDAASLAFAVRNGGPDLEHFSLAGAEIHHGAPYSTLITAKGGLGATDGQVIIGDDRRSLVIRHDPAVAALIPTVRFIPQGDGRYFLRLRYAAQEIDETFVPSDAPWQVAWTVGVTLVDRGVSDLVKEDLELS